MEKIGKTHKFALVQQSYAITIFDTPRKDIPKEVIEAHQNVVKNGYLVPTYKKKNFKEKEKKKKKCKQVEK